MQKLIEFLHSRKEFGLLLFGENPFHLPRKIIVPYAAAMTGDGYPRGSKTNINRASVKLVVTPRNQRRVYERIYGLGEILRRKSKHTGCLRHTQLLFPLEKVENKNLRPGEIVKLIYLLNRRSYNALRVIARPVDTSDIGFFDVFSCFFHSRCLYCPQTPSYTKD